MNIFRKAVRHFRGPRCHLEPEEKAWVEQRLLWLHQQFGPEPVRRPPLDPTSSLLPRRWSGSDEDGVGLLQRLCSHMQVDATRIELQFYSDAEPIQVMAGYHEVQKAGPAGLYFHPDDPSRVVIGLDGAGLNRPGSLAATICHELGHVHLLADRRIALEEPDGEPLTDLLTVYFGAGILTANAAFQFNQWQEGRMQGWSASAQGYLSEALWGYSLACYARFRGDADAVWRKHLRENIAYYFEDSMHFLATTGDTSIAVGGA